MFWHRASLLLAALLVSTLGWTQTPAAGTPAQPSVSGTIAYRERIALPSDAAIEVKIKDMMGPDGNTIAETVFSRLDVDGFFLEPVQMLGTDPAKFVWIARPVES